MSPGSPDLTAVSLPILPEGHRWAISRKTKLRESGWGDSWTYKGLGIALQRQEKNWRGRVVWKSVDARELAPRGNQWLSGMSVRDSLVDLVEYVAQDIYDQQVKQLQRLLEEESIIGIYQDEALPN